MIFLERDSRRFNYRVAAVVLDGSPEESPDGRRVLLHHADHESFWSLPGGRVELGEASADALVRELAEEIGVRARVERPLWLVENFFPYEGCDCQELGIYYLTSLAEDSGIHEKNGPFPGHEEGVVLVYQWHPIADLDRIEIRPTFLREAIAGLDAGPPDLPADGMRHVVHHDVAH